MEIREVYNVDINATGQAEYKKHLANCIIKLSDGRLFLQKRPDNWWTYPGVINLFGGHVEDGESIKDAVIREVAEETGGSIEPDELVYLSSLLEEDTGFTELVHIFFWHDKRNTVTGCYEAEGIYFENAEEAISHPKTMDYSVHALRRAKTKGLIL